MVRVKAKPRRSLKLCVKEVTQHPTLVFYTPKLYLHRATSSNHHYHPQIVNKSPPPVYDANTETVFVNGNLVPLSSLVHPLSSKPDFPKLTDLQNMITQAILLNGEPCPFDKIYEFVNLRWKEMDIRRRNGTPYATDCRRAIKANLRHNHVTLFKEDPKTQGHWRLCSVVEETPKTQKEKKEPEKEKEVVDNKKIKDKENNKREKITIEKELKPKKRNYLPSGPKTRSKNRTLRSNVTTRNTNNNNSQSSSDFTDLQILISYAIEAKDESASVTDITNIIGKLINELKPNGANSKRVDPRDSIINCLSKNHSIAPLFMRDPSNYRKWKYTQHHPWLIATPEDKKAKVKEVENIIASTRNIKFMEDGRIMLVNESH